MSLQLVLGFWIDSHRVFAPILSVAEFDDLEEAIKYVHVLSRNISLGEC